MSRSMKHTPVTGMTCADSDKWWKTNSNRRFRHKTKLALKADKDPPENPDEVSDVWDAPKDGHHWWGWEAYREGVESWRGEWTRPHDIFGK